MWGGKTNAALLVSVLVSLVSVKGSNDAISIAGGVYTNLVVGLTSEALAGGDTQSIVQNVKVQQCHIIQTLVM